MTEHLSNSELRRPRWAIAVLSALLIIAGAVAIAVAEHAQFRQRVQAQTVQDVSGTRAELESAIANRLALVDGLAAFAIASDGDVAENFDAFAVGLAGSHRSYTGLQGSDPALRSLQLAPDAVVTYVWPLEGNEAAVGHDLLADPQRGPAVQRAIDDRRFVLAGPFPLIQGGLGLVGRNPVYLGERGNDEFWGLATVVINFDVMAAEAGLDEAAERGMVYAIRGKDGLGADGDVFFGDENVFDHDPVVLEVLVPNGTWQVAAHPIGGWPAMYDRATPLTVLAVGLVTAVAMAVTVLRSERAAAERERIAGELSRIVNSTDSPIIAVDGDYSISEWNRAAAELTGLDRDHVIGADLSTVCAEAMCSADQVVHVRAAVTAALEGRITESVEVTLGSESEAILLFNVSPRRSDDGGIGGAVCIARDVTSQRETERILAENMAMARSARLKDEFLASMSHELRTPLNAIIGLGRVLHGGAYGSLEDRQREYVGQIVDSGEHLLALINDVLDLAKIEANATTIDLVPVDMGELVRDSLRVIGPLAKQKRLVPADPATSGHLTLSGDPLRIRQVLLNLLSNAVKFTGEEGAFGVEVVGGDDKVDVTVWDTGIGIPEDQQHVLFEPFQQVDGSLAREHEGTGLGLALVAKLVGLHGGTVSVESEAGRGSRFTISLPRHPIAVTAG